MSRLQCFHGRIVELRRYTNVQLYGRGPLGPTDRYELWIKPSDGVERKFTINTRTMPARRGHDVSIIVTSHKVPLVLALANWSTIDGVNYARTDAPSLFRASATLAWCSSCPKQRRILRRLALCARSREAAEHSQSTGRLTWRHGESISSA